ncbi:MAG: CYTH domain-containing protein [Muribaculaceae bacterium]|nr:CYTH domain-containing protein [Muribaculaceae bacterium]
MAKEIERKFLVRDLSFLEQASCSFDIRQGYLSVNPEATVRVRTKGERGFLTVKGITQGASRHEWEYEIPLSDAEEMLRLCPPDKVLEKTRFIVGRWEVDMFHGRLDGLILAEIELRSEDEPVTLPSFIGEEVTGDSRYYNSVLAISTP